MAQFMLLFSRKVYTMDLFLLPKDVRCRIVCILLGAVKVDKDAKEVCFLLTYCKNLKNWDTQKHCCNCPKIQTGFCCHRAMHPKYADGIANSVAPDQNAPTAASRAV